MALIYQIGYSAAVADFVLLHGTTQGPGGWDRLLAALASRGHRGVAVDLAGSDDRDPDEYVRAVAGQLPADLTAPIVVAHSGSGVLLPATATALGARRQVWLAAFVPDGRRSFREEVPPEPAAVFNPEWLGVDPTVDPVAATYFLFHDCDLPTLRWALTTLRLFTPTRLYQQPVALAGHIPSAYLLAARDRTLRPDWCRREASRRLGAEVVEIDAGHCPHVSRPERTADILDRLATGTPA